MNTRSNRDGVSEADKARTTIDEAHEENDTERSEAPVVPDYADDDGQSFRAVDEPTVPPDDRGKPLDDEERETVEDPAPR